MKKGIFPVLLAATIAISAAGCSSAPDEKEVDSEKNQSIASVDESQTDSGSNQEIAAPIEVTEISISDDVSGSLIGFDIKVKNVSGTILHSINLNISFLDKDGNIVGATYPSFPNRLNADQSTIIQALTDNDIGVASICVDGYSATDTNEQYYDGYFETPVIYDLN